MSRILSPVADSKSVKMIVTALVLMVSSFYIGTLFGDKELVFIEDASAPSGPGSLSPPLPSYTHTHNADTLAQMPAQ